MSKMSPEKARELRDAGGHRPHGGAAQLTGSRKTGASVLPSGLHKRRVLRFDARYPAEADEAQVLLGGLPGFTAVRAAAANALCIHYAVDEYTLEGVVKALEKQGFHLANAWHVRLARAFIAFLEETQLRNLYGSQRLIKRSQDVYSRAWDHHLHGDHDATPAELRQDK